LAMRKETGCILHMCINTLCWRAKTVICFHSNHIYISSCSYAYVWNYYIFWKYKTMYNQRTCTLACCFLVFYLALKTFSILLEMKACIAIWNACILKGK
jgi:hypothetical protein